MASLGTRRYLRLAFYTGLWVGIEELGHTIVRQNFVRHKDELSRIKIEKIQGVTIASLSYEVVAYILAAVAVYLWVAHVSQRRDATPGAGVMTRGQMLKWTAALGFCSVLNVLPYFIAIGLTTPAAVYPLLAASVLWLAFWERIIVPRLQERFAFFQREYELPTERPMPWKTVRVPLLLVVIGMAFASATEVNPISIIIHSVWSPAFLLVAGASQLLLAARSVVMDQSFARIEAISKELCPDLDERQRIGDWSKGLVLVWRNIWSLIISVVLVILVALVTGRWKDFFDVWFIKGRGRTWPLVGLLVALGAVVMYVLELTWQTEALTAARAAGRKPSEVALVSTWSVILGVIFTGIASWQGWHLLGNPLTGWGVWILKSSAAFLVVAGILLLWHRERERV